MYHAEVQVHHVEVQVHHVPRRRHQQDLVDHNLRPVLTDRVLAIREDILRQIKSRGLLHPLVAVALGILGPAEESVTEIAVAVAALEAAIWIRLDSLVVRIPQGTR